MLYQDNDSRRCTVCDQFVPIFPFGTKCLCEMVVANHEATSGTTGIDLYISTAGKGQPYHGGGDTSTEDYSIYQDSRPAARRSPSHVSRGEWWAVILVASLILGYLFNHIGDGIDSKSSRWRADQAQMEADLKGAGEVRR